MSSGAIPGCDVASAQWITPVVDSARMLRAYPGDLRWTNQQNKAQMGMSWAILSTFVALVNVRIEVNVRDITIEYGTRRFYHSV